MYLQTPFISSHDQPENWPIMLRIQINSKHTHTPTRKKRRESVGKVLNRSVSHTTRWVVLVPWQRRTQHPSKVGSSSRRNRLLIRVQDGSTVLPPTWLQCETESENCVLSGKLWLRYRSSIRIFLLCWILTSWRDNQGLPDYLNPKVSVLLSIFRHLKVIDPIKVSITTSRVLISIDRHHFWCAFTACFFLVSKNFPLNQPGDPSLHYRC